MAVSTDGQMIRILTDARIDTMLDNVIDCLSQEDYLGACEAFLEDVARYAALGVPDDQYNYDSETGEIDEYVPAGRGNISAGDLVVYLCGSLAVARPLPLGWWPTATAKTAAKTPTLCGRKPPWLCG